MACEGFFAAAVSKIVKGLRLLPEDFRLLECTGHNSAEAECAIGVTDLHWTCAREVFKQEGVAIAMQKQREIRKSLNSSFDY